MLHFTVLLLGFSIFLGYCITVKIRHKKVSSISESDYLNKKPFRFMFELNMFISGVTLTYCGWFLPGKSPLLMLGGLLVFGVGLFPEFKKSLFEKIMHYFTAVGGFMICGFSFWVDFNFWYLSAFIASFTILTLVLPLKDKIFWVEIVSASTIFLSIFHTFILQ